MSHNLPWRKQPSVNYETLPEADEPKKTWWNSVAEQTDALTYKKLLELRNNLREETPPHNFYFSETVEWTEYPFSLLPHQEHLMRTLTDNALKEIISAIVAPFGQPLEIAITRRLDGNGSTIKLKVRLHNLQGVEMETDINWDRVPSEDVCVAQLKMQISSVLSGFYTSETPINNMIRKARSGRTSVLLAGIEQSPDAIFVAATPSAASILQTQFENIAGRIYHVGQAGLAELATRVPVIYDHTVYENELDLLRPLAPNVTQPTKLRRNVTGPRLRTFDG